MNRDTTLPTSLAATRNSTLIEPASRIERLLGKSASKWTEHDLANVFVTLNLRQVSLMHVCGDGMLKTLDFAPRDHNHFMQIVRYGERADGSSLFPGLGIASGASDIVLKPRLETAFVDPFSREGTLAILCGHITREGKPLPQSGDSVVRRAYDLLLKESGYELHALGEIEYFIGHHAADNVDVTNEDRGYHASAPMVFGQELRRRALTLLAEMGVPAKYAHSEVGFAGAESDSDLTWEQHEIELALRPLPEAADSVALTHWVLRNLAHEAGLRISFDPVVKRGHAGSGMHFHLAGYRDGQYLTVLEAGGKVSKYAEVLIAGLLKHGCALMVFGNRTKSSFVRLFQGKESPAGVTWGQYNRKALVRLPIITKDADGGTVTAETVEFRLPDGSAVPHFLLAGIVQAARAANSFTDRSKLLDSLRADAKDTVASKSIPRGFAEIAELLEQERAVFEANDVFSPVLMDAEIARLKSAG
ncbi:glutamine synthetase [bacterium]|nr:glutamine synthetase [bacterium]